MQHRGHYVWKKETSEYLIRTEVQPAYEPAVVERYRFKEITHENVEIRQTNVCQIVFTADGWCRLIIRDVMLKDEAEYTVRVVNEAGTCISTAYLTVFTDNYRGEDGKGAD